MTRDRSAVALLLTSAVFAGSVVLGSAGCSEQEQGPAPQQGIESPWTLYPCGVLWDIQRHVGYRILGPIPGTLSLDMYPLTADARFNSPTDSACAAEVAEALTALCDPCNREPSSCELRVRGLFRDPPAVCHICGDDVCSGGEDEHNCPRDCAARCGDGICSGGETALSCPIDCATACGDGFCRGDETPENCPEDCMFTIGDGICSPGEDPYNSPEDCLDVACGDGFCQPWENPLRCPEDCCGPKACELGAGSFCMDANTLGTCAAGGAHGCPQAVIQSHCPLGCVRDGEASRCRSCGELRSLPGDLCSPGAAPECAGPWATAHCEQVPGHPTCHARSTIHCPPGTICMDGACAACRDDTCTPGATRCNTRGQVETCVRSSGCTLWSLSQDCGPARGCHVIAGEAPRCVSCCRLIGARTCAGDHALQVCKLTPGSDPTCGAWVHDLPCHSGSVCSPVPGSDSLCLPCCQAGDARCVEGDEGPYRELCRALSSDPACGRWEITDWCHPGDVCVPDPANGDVCVHP